MSGQVSSIVVDLGSDPTGNTVYVGSSSGGLWRSTNGLSSSPSFTLLSDQTKSLSVGAAALDTSTKPLTIFVGTGAPDNAGNVASYTGTGILISRDGGGSWTLVQSADEGAHPFTGQGFSNILVDPLQPHIVLASTGFGTDPNFPPAALPQGNPGFAHLGIYRSTDSGNHWTQVMSASYGGSLLAPGGFFHTELIYEPTKNTYFAGISQQGIFASFDQGQTWKSLTAVGRGQGLPNASQIRRISLATRNGSLWALLLMAPFQTSDAFQLFQSDDQGGSWRQLALPPDPPGGHFKGALMYVAAPPNSNALLFATQFLYRTDDIRATNPSWFAIENNLHGDQHAIAFACPDKVPACVDKWYVGDDGGAWATTTGGKIWSSLNNDLRTGEFYSADADWGGTDRFAGGLQDNNPAINLDSPAWQMTNGPCGGDGLYVAAIPRDPQAFFMSSQWGCLFYARVSADDSLSFSQQLVAFGSNNANFATPFEVLPNDPRLYLGVRTPLSFDFSASRIVLLGAQNPLLLAFNPSVSLNAVYTAQVSSQVNQFIAYIVSSPIDPTTAYLSAGTYGAPTALYRLTNINFGGNATVTAITGGPVNGDVLGHLAVSSSGSLYVVKAGFLRQKIFKTSDGRGNSWVDISGNLPNVPVNWIAIDPNDANAIYVATNIGVFTAEDGGTEGEQWKVLGQGLPNVPVMQLKMTRARKLIAATYGRGVWSFDLPFQPPQNCSVMIVVCGNEATLVCDPIRNILFLGARKSFVQPVPDFMPGGFTVPTQQFGNDGTVDIVYDAPIELGDNEFEACAQEQSPPFRRSCVWPIPSSGPDLYGCPGHPPPPLPKPSQCIKAGCRPRPQGGCICE